jgi:hypothetical protein
MTPDTNFPLLFSSNCFNAPLPQHGGGYNPRIDGIVIHAGNPDLFPIILAHEGKGHRSGAVQGSILRIQRHYAGLLYACIAQLLDFMNTGRFDLRGKTLDTFQISGNVRDFVPIRETPDDLLLYLIRQIKRLHSAISEIYDEIRVVYEVIALAWTSRELRRLLPEDQAKKYDAILLEAEKRELQSKIDPKEFEEIYLSYTEIESQELLLGIELHALDVCNWTMEEKMFDYPCANFSGQVERFKNLVNNVKKMSVNDASNLIRTGRDRDLNFFERWLTYFNLFPSRAIVESDARFLWQLMALLDISLFESIGHLHHHCDSAGECMDLLNESTFKHVISPNGTSIQIDHRITDIAISGKINGFVGRYVHEYKPEDDRNNPLNIDRDWYKWILLFDSLYLSLVLGGGISCPLAQAQKACGRKCPIRVHLADLAQRSDLVTGPLCQLVDE